MKASKSILHPSFLILFLVVLVVTVAAPAVSHARKWTYYSLDESGNYIPLTAPTEQEIQDTAVRRVSDDVPPITQWALEIKHDFSGTWGTGYLENIGNPSPDIGKNWINDSEEVNYVTVDGTVQDTYNYYSRYIARGYNAQGPPNSQDKAHALRFDGTNDYVTAPDINLSYTDRFSIDFWARREENGREDRFFSQGPYVSYQYFSIGFHSSNQFFFHFAGVGEVNTNAYTDLNWHQWRVEYRRFQKRVNDRYQVKRYYTYCWYVRRCSGAWFWKKCWNERHCQRCAYWVWVDNWKYAPHVEISIYRDDKKVKSQEFRVSNHYSSRDTTLQIGRTSAYFKGQMKDIVVKREGQVIGAWHFNEPTGSTTAVDASGNNRHAILHNFPLDTCWVIDPNVVKFYEFAGIEEKQTVSPFKMNGPGNVIYKWDRQFAVAVNAEVGFNLPKEKVENLPFIEVTDQSGQERHTGSGRWWYLGGTGMKLSAPAPEDRLLSVSGYRNNKTGLAIDGVDEIVVTGLDQDMNITWLYTPEIWEIPVTVGSPVTFESIPEVLRKRILATEKPVEKKQTDTGEIQDIQSKQEEGPQAKQYYWSGYEKKLYPLIGGTFFLMEWKLDGDDVLYTRVIAQWPEAPHVLHVAGTVPVHLDPSQSDEVAFKELVYTEGDGAVSADLGFTATQKGKSVLLLTRTNVQDPEPKQTSLSFDGKDDYVNFGDAISLDIAELTAEFWARRASIDDFHVAIGQGPAIENQGLHIGFLEDNRFTFGFYKNDLVTPEAYAYTDWHHWACVYESEDLDLDEDHDPKYVSLFFDGKDDSVDVINGVDLTGGEFTAEFWAKPASNDRAQTLLGQGVMETDKGLQIGYRADNTFTFRFYNNDLNTPEADPYTDTAWHHWACVMETEYKAPREIALSFDGVNDYVEIKDPFENNQTDFTISLWVRPRVINDGQYHGFIGRYVGTYREPSLWVHEGGLAYYSNAPDGGNYSGTLFDFFTVAGEWIHIAWVKDGTQYRFYKNGVLFATRTAPEEIYVDTSSPYWFGRVDNFFPGEIDEVRIWNAVRSEEKIKEDKDRTLTGNEPGLVGYWRFDNGTGNTTEDGTVNANKGTLTNMDLSTVWVFNGGPYADPKEIALAFDGEDDHVEVPHYDGLNVTDELTLEAWVYPNVLAGDTRVLGKIPVPEEQNPVETNEGYALGVSKDGKLHPEIWDNAGSKFSFQSGTVPARQWTHLAVTWQTGGDLIGYVNGFEVQRVKASGNPLSTTLASLYMGAVPSVDATIFQGKIDEVRIWNRVRSAEEIRGYKDRALKGDEAGLVGYWRFDDGAGETAKNAVEVGNDGTLNNLDPSNAWLVTTTPFNPNLKEIALTFDGTDDYVEVDHHDSLNATDSLTLEAWVKLNKAAEMMIAGKAQISPNRAGYVLGVSPDGWLYPEVWDSEGTPHTLQAGTFSLGEWTHLAFTWQRNGNLIGYVNGEEVDRVITGQNPIGAANSPLRIGAAPWDVNAFQVDGMIDEVRVWNVARGAEEIKKWKDRRLNGNEAGLVGYWRFDDNTGYTVRDSTANVLHGTLVNMDPSAGAWTVETANLRRRIYRDGLLVAQDHPSGSYQGTGSLAIGRTAWGTDFFHGQIDDVRIWNVPRTADEIHAYTNTRLNGNEAGLIGYWRFDEGSGASTKDSTANANDGRLVAMNPEASWIYRIYKRQIYRDGELVAEDETLEPYAGSGDLVVGMAGWNDGFFHGQIDEVRIWNTPRSETQIQENRDKRLNGDEEGLIGYWRFDSAGMSYAEDSTGNWNNGLLVNMDVSESWSVDPKIPPPDPAEGNLDRESVVVRVVETRLWNEDLQWDVATVGTEITSDYHGKEVPHNGYVFWEKARYNPDIYDRQAKLGPIIPVNVQYTDKDEKDDIVVVWYRMQDGTSWPYQPVEYTCQWPADRRIVVASRLGSDGKDASGKNQVYEDVNGDPKNYFDPARYRDLKIYNQPDPGKAGYNPNEEHALIAPSLRHAAAARRPQAAFALRNDLNIATRNETYTSDPYALVQYYDNVKQRYGMAVFKVEVSDWPAGYRFWYAMNAGDPVVAPYPLDTVIGATPPNEIIGQNGDPGRICYWEDHKGQPWAVSGAGKSVEISGVSPAGGNAYNVTLESETLIPDHFYEVEVRDDSGLIGSMRFRTGSSEPYPYSATSAVYVGGSAIAGGDKTFTVTLNPGIGGLEKKHFTLYHYESNAHILSYFWYPLAPSFWCDGSLSGCKDCSAPGDGTGDVGKPVPWLWPVQVRYEVNWPDDVPVLKAGETLTFPGGEYRADNTSAPGLPGVLGWAAGQVIFDELNPVMNSEKLKDTYLVRMIPALLERTVPLSLDDYPENYKPASKQVDVIMGLWYFKELHAGLKKRFFYDPMTGKLGFRGFINDKTLGDEDLTASPPSVYVLQPNILTKIEKETILALPGLNQPFKAAVEALFTLTRDPNNVVEDDVQSDYYGAGLDWVIALTEQSFSIIRGELGVTYKLTSDSLGKIETEGEPYVQFTQKALDELEDEYWFMGTACDTSGIGDLVGNYYENEEKLKEEVKNKVNGLQGKYCNNSRISFDTNEMLDLILQHTKKDVHEIVKDKLYKNDDGSDKEYDTKDAFEVDLKTTFGAKNFDTLKWISRKYLVKFDDTFVIAGVEKELKGKAYSSKEDFERDLENIIGPLWHKQKSEAEETFNLAPPRNVDFYAEKIWDSVENTRIVPEIVMGKGRAVVPNGALLDPDDPVFSKFTEGHVTLVENNHPDLGALPVTLRIIKVVKDKYRGAIKTVFSDNVFDEKITLRHTADFGANPDDLKFQWWYREEDGKEQPPPDKEPVVWKVFPDPTGEDGLGMSEISLAGAGAALLVDNLFFCRYRHKASDPNVAASWSNWAGAANSRPPKENEEPEDTYQPQLAEGWVKRVLNAVNPFEARIRDFYSSDSPATYVSMIQQAGPRYEGPVAFNPEKDVIENVGLIELYQTVLERAKDLSIDLKQPVSTSGVTAALLLAATRIAGFYTLLGNEAYTDALDSTIGIGSDSVEYGSLAPTIFCFMNQVPNLLDEELDLLRGRDEEGARPVYNRLLWNFTKGQGEVAYAISYNIKDENGDGFIDEADGRATYPQGHGDAWGHYLTALKSYYDLLTHPYFNWESRAEKFSIEGVVLDVDYLDERKFAEAAAAKAKVGTEIVHLSYRARYVEDPDGQWQGYSDTEEDRAWGVSGWGRRAFQGALFDWATANALLPAKDENPEHTGVKKIDRRTVREILEIASQARHMQEQFDSVNTGLNPLGLAVDVVPFDIDPARLNPAASNAATHFEQVYERALNAVENARIIFDHASDMKNRIRQVAESAETFKEQVDAQDRDYRNRLIELLGTPYEGVIGPGKLYPAGYKGPDYFLYMYVDVNNISADTVPEPSEELTGYYAATVVTYNWPGSDSVDLKEELRHFFVTDLEGFTAVDGSESLKEQVVHYPMSAADYSFQAPKDWGIRRSPGEIQQALIELVKAEAELYLALDDYGGLLSSIQTAVDLLQAKAALHAEKLQISADWMTTTRKFNAAILTLRNVAEGMELAADLTKDYADAAAEGTPKAVGLATDPSFAARLALKMGGATGQNVLKISALAAKAAADGVEAEKEIAEMEKDVKVEKAEYKYEIKEQLKEIESLLGDEAGKRVEIFRMRENMRQVSEKYRAVLAKALRLMEERKAFNARVAAKTQGNRYQDMAFRVNLNDALSKYRSAFDTAGRYVYLAAKAYDYETNLSDRDPASAQPLLTDVVRQRTLGQFVDGTAVAGRGGLADVLAQLKVNYAVLKGQMGFNNPQTETDRFSLRKELFRIRESNDKAWREELERHRVADLWSVPEFRKFCRPFAPQGAGAQPGLVLPFSTRVVFGKNFFGWPLGGGDHAYDPTNFATKVRSVGLWFENYDNTLLSETPRAYLVPVGMDVMLVADSNELDCREWTVVDQRLPVPLPVGDSDMNNPEFIPGVDSLNGSMIQIRRYSSFRAYHDQGYFDQTQMSYDSRLIGRSVWNTRWLLIIPGGTFLADPNEGLDTFIHGMKIPGATDGSRDGNGVKDIKLFFQTYAISGG